MRRLPWRTSVFAAGFVLVVNGYLPAQDVTEPSLKAAGLYKVAIYTEWPADAMPAGSPFNVCVLGDKSLAEAVVREMKGRTIGTHDITVTALAPPAMATRNCNLLYVSGLSVASAVQATAAVRDAPVLTLSDIDGFPEGGGIARMYLEHGRLRFTVNMASVKRARLQISARLLALAKRI
jgi:hypothetical protein